MLVQVEWLAWAIHRHKLSNPSLANNIVFDEPKFDTLLLHKNGVRHVVFVNWLEVEELFVETTDYVLLNGNNVYNKYAYN